LKICYLFNVNRVQYLGRRRTELNDASTASGPLRHAVIESAGESASTQVDIFSTCSNEDDVMDTCDFLRDNNCQSCLSLFS